MCVAKVGCCVRAATVGAFNVFGIKVRGRSNVEPQCIRCQNSPLRAFSVPTFSNVLCCVCVFVFVFYFDFLRLSLE
jgi:hypothetical protein